MWVVSFILWSVSFEEKPPVLNGKNGKILKPVYTRWWKEVSVHTRNETMVIWPTSGNFHDWAILAVPQQWWWPRRTQKNDDNDHNNSSRLIHKTQWQLYFNISQQVGVITNNNWQLCFGNNILKDNCILQQVWYHSLRQKGEVSAHRWSWSIPLKRNLANKPRRLRNTRTIWQNYIHNKYTRKSNT